MKKLFTYKMKCENCFEEKQCYLVIDEYFDLEEWFCKECMQELRIPLKEE